jgi:hypothetical protein
MSNNQLRSIMAEARRVRKADTIRKYKKIVKE